EEGNEVLVFKFGLSQGRGAALGVPGIADLQLSASNVLRIGVGVDQGLQGHACHVEAVVLHGVHGTVEQHLVRLLGADVRQWVIDLLVSTGSSQEQQYSQQSNQRNTTR